MDYELWKEPRVVVTGVMLLVIAQAVYKRNQVRAGRSPVVSCAVPWVGSALDLGKSPDRVFQRAMYVECLSGRSEAENKPPAPSAKHGDIFTVKALASPAPLPHRWGAPKSPYRKAF